MSSTFKDFDAFRAEAEGTGPSFKLFGETHHLPPSLPLALMAQAAYLQTRDDAEEINPAELMNLAKGIFGEARFEGWIDQGLDLDTLGALILWIPDAYNGTEDDDGDPDPGN